MKASIDLQRSDLIRGCLRLFPYLPANRNFVLVVAALFALWQIWQAPWLDHQRLLQAVFGGLLAGLAGILAGVLIQMVVLWFRVPRQPGVLGRHEFELTEAGLIVHSSIGEGQVSWVAVQRVLVLKNYLLLQLGGGLHILPRRSFESEVDFDAFCAEAQRLHTAAGVTGGSADWRWLPLTAIAVLVLFALQWQGGREQAELQAAEEQSYSQSQADLLAGLEIEVHREVQNGTRMLVLGSLHNAGSRTASSIQIEVELFDGDGQFVYECSEYISRDLAPGERENFQVNCGCGKNAAPEHVSMTVRVVSASNYD